jgi:hypothetical protein
MTDARFPERWLNDRRLVRLPDAVFRLFIVSLAWSVANRTDGRIYDDDLPLIPGGQDGGHVWILADTGIWIRCHDRSYWLIADFEETQTTREQLEATATARQKARDKKRRQRAAASVVPRDNTRPGQARPGQAPQTVGRGLRADPDGGSDDQSPDGSSRPRVSRAAARDSGGTTPAPAGVQAATPLQSLRDHNGPDPSGSDVQNFSNRGTSRGQPADRNAREACPICGLKQKLHTNGKLARHGPKFTPCRGSGMALTGTSS